MTQYNYQYHRTHFLTSAPNIRSLPIDSGIEIAFAGLSNVGKSSALNTLSNQKKLVRISKMPGHTKQINIFEVESGIRLVDLPGYGYAVVPEKIKIQWQNTIREYLKRRTSLKGLVVIMDIRYPMKHLDQQIVKLAVDVNLPVLVLLTKADKLATGACKLQLIKVRKITLNFASDIQVEIFSSLKKQGVDKLRHKLNAWFYCHSVGRLE